MAPQLVYGTATFGMDITEFQDATGASKMLETVRSLGIRRIDTAPRYPPFCPGRAEQLRGEAIEVSSDFTVDTKVYTDTRTYGSDDLQSNAIERSISESLGRLKRPQGVSLHQYQDIYN